MYSRYFASSVACVIYLIVIIDEYKHPVALPENKTDESRSINNSMHRKKHMWTQGNIIRRNTAQNQQIHPSKYTHLTTIPPFLHESITAAASAQ